MRGLDPDHVYGYLDRLADQLDALTQERDQAREHNDRLRLEVRRLQLELEEQEDAGARVNDQVVQLFSKAQLIAEEMVSDASRDAQERIGQARAHERKIVEEAMQVAGQEINAYARSAQEQMQSIMSSFASEVKRLGDPATVHPPSARQQRPDPLFDDPSEWHPGARRPSSREYD